MKSVLTPLAKSVLIPLELSACRYSKKYGLGTTASVSISNEEMEDIVKIFKSLEESGQLIKEICETIKNQAK